MSRTNDLTVYKRAQRNIVFRLLGPGLVTGAADDDPSGIATYSQAGAQFGYSLLWTVFLTTPFMIAIQLVSAYRACHGQGHCRQRQAVLSPATRAGPGGPFGCCEHHQHRG